MPASETHQKGAELRRQLMGEGYVDRINQTIYDDPHMQKFRDLTTKTIFGTLWTRPGLDLKTRTLICVVSDTVMGRAPRAPRSSGKRSSPPRKCSRRSARGADPQRAARACMKRRE